jgi:putative membrane protein
MTRRLLLAVAALALLTAGPLQAEGKEPKGGAALDNDFLIKSHSVNHAQIEYSKLAEKRASGQKVKEYSQLMLRDQREIQEALAKLLKDRKTSSVTGPERETRDEVDRLSKLEGAEFDREYMQRMVKEHDAVVTLFETQARDGKDNAITAWAKETLPTLKKHQQQAKELSDEVAGKK